ncbi:hypothetical protein STRIP9103_00669, partial [Streptomyces ipomoeae 91-03]
ADEFAAAGEVGGGTVAGVLHGGDAEVGEDDPAGAVEEDVAGLDVAVQHTDPVGGGERVHDLGADGGGLARVEQAPVAQDVVHGRPVDEFHDDQGAAVDLGHVVHGDDSGVPDAGGGPGLALHPQPQVGQFGHGGVRVGAQLLEGDLAVEHFVHGPPDHAHAAASELLDDPVPPGEKPSDTVRLFVRPRRHLRPVPVTNR